MTGRIFLALLVLVGSVSAQLDSGLPSMNHRVRIHVDFANGGEVCDTSTRVALMSRADAAVAQGPTDKSCSVEFFNIAAGTYYLKVSGSGFASVDTSEIVVNSPDTDTVEVRVNRTRSRPGKDAAASSSSVAVADLRIPSRAAEEFDKASQFMEQQSWRKARERLQKAIEIYPSYTAAYNNLGVVYARLGDRRREGEMLRKAISSDDRYVPAYVNLARMSIAANNFQEAETQLNKAAALDPSDGVALVLLTYAEFGDHHFDDAISTCRRVHAMPQTPHAGAHWVAGQAFEQKDQLADAAAEFQLFLNEEQSGPRADLARKELANLKDFFFGKQ